MNKLVKYILIINLLFLSFFIIGSLSNSFMAYYDKVNIQPPQYDSNGNQMIQTRPSSNLYPTYSYLLFALSILIFGLIIYLSAKYLCIEPTLKGFFTSLIIPISLIIFSLVLLFIKEKFDPCSGEECMYQIFWAGYYLAILLIPSIINFIIFLIKRKQ